MWMVFTSGPKVFVADWQSIELKDKNFQLIDIRSYSHQNGADTQASSSHCDATRNNPNLSPSSNEQPRVGERVVSPLMTKRSARTATKEENEDIT
jgi:hypothetical protein